MSIVRLEGHSHTGTSKHCRQTCSPQQPRALCPIPARGDPYPGHSTWEGFGGSPGVMPSTPRTNVHGDSFRNQILHFFSNNTLCLPGKDGIKWKKPQIPLHFDMHNQKKGTDNYPSQLQLLSPTSGDLVFILFMWKNCYDQLLLFCYIYLC